MDKNEWYRAGEDIRDQVQRAVESGDFTDLGKNIGSTVNDTINRTVGVVGESVGRTAGTVGEGVGRTVGAVGEGVGRAVEAVGESVGRTVEAVGGSISRAMNDVGSAFGRPASGTNKQGGTAPGRNGVPGKSTALGGNGAPDGSIYANRPQYRLPNVRPDARLFQRVPKGSVSGVVYMGTGYGVMGISLLALIGSVGELAASVGSVGAVVWSAAFALLGFALGYHGSRLSGRAKRYTRYVNMVKDKLYCPIRDMAQRLGKSERFVVKDLKKMIQAGMFKQARLDQKETCLIASNEMYEQYMLVQKDYEEQQKKQEMEKQADERKKQEKERLGEAAGVIDEGLNYVRLIRQCNDEIPGEEMSDKLDRLELLVTRIFDQVEKEPELAPELRKMLSYYLPTTKKLLEAYRDLDRQQLDVANVTQTKREIETAVDNINEAFEKFLDELFREKAWDIQSDISVLHTMMKQDGLLS